MREEHFEQDNHADDNNNVDIVEDNYLDYNMGNESNFLLDDFYN